MPPYPYRDCDGHDVLSLLVVYLDFDLPSLSGGQHIPSDLKRGQPRLPLGVVKVSELKAILIVRNEATAFAYVEIELRHASEIHKRKAKFRQGSERSAFTRG